MTTTTTTAPTPDAPIDAVKLLRSTFPVFRENKPLAIGIHKGIAERLPQLSKDQIRTAMRRHTASTHYLKALATGTTRFDLDGNPAGPVTSEQQHQAGDELKERLRKGAERKRLEQKEKAAKEREALKDQETQHKLLELAQKFSRR